MEDIGQFTWDAEGESGESEIGRSWNVSIVDCANRAIAIGSCTRASEKRKSASHREGCNYLLGKLAGPRAAGRTRLPYPQHKGITSALRNSRPGFSFSTFHKRLISF